MEASALSPIVAPAVRSGVLRIEHRDPHFSSHLTIVFESGPVEARFALESDGREVASTDERGQRIVSGLGWEGEVDGGRGLRAEEELRCVGRDQDNIWVFNRSNDG